MTSFFNKKEEVLDIQLTQFGKQLLAKGRFKPVYYAFYDSNILYDGAHGEITEEQNDIEGRIQEETAQPRTQHVFSSRARDFVRTVKETYGSTPGGGDEAPLLYDEIAIQSTAEKHFSLVNPLGNSNFESRVAPNWKLTFLDGEYAQTASFYLSDFDRSATKVDGVYQTFPELQIPQISMNVTYVTNVQTGDQTVIQQANEAILDQFTVKDANTPNPIDTSVIFQDGSVIEVNFKDGSKDLLLMVEENGVTFGKENFEIEVYNIDSGGSYTPLFFKEEPTNVVDGLLVSEVIPEIIVDIDNTYVEHYFDIHVDSKINKKIICEAISEVKSRGIYVDAPIECEDVISSPTTISPYQEGRAKDSLCPDE
jgi:hypothetical protein